MTRRIERCVRVLIVAGLLVIDVSTAVSAHGSGARPSQVAGPTFVYPASGTTYSTTAPYRFKVKPISRATGYLWSFVQGGAIIYQNLASDGHLSPPSYTVVVGSVAHQLIHVGNLQVRV